ncbi:MAG TPA: hypothetical protein VK324_11800 [Tepidisphaeraceae bacterium]|nr:hypothetical protein [Tepidisphaeraceae bacterium]
MRDPASPVLALVRDLMFVGRITAEARAAGVAVRVIRDPLQLTSADPSDLLVVDLNLSGATDAAGAWRRATGGQVVGFVSHVDAAAAAAAREAGVDRVLARSRFVEVLPTLLKGG